MLSTVTEANDGDGDTPDNVGENAFKVTPPSICTVQPTAMYALKLMPLSYRYTT